MDGENQPCQSGERRFLNVDVATLKVVGTKTLVRLIRLAVA